MFLSNFEGNPLGPIRSIRTKGMSPSSRSKENLFTHFKPPVGGMSTAVSHLVASLATVQHLEIVLLECDLNLYSASVFTGGKNGQTHWTGIS